MNTGQSKAAFLFGSGISLKTYQHFLKVPPFPDVEGITNTVLGSRPASPSLAADAVERAQKFLRILADYLAPHLFAREGRKVNYEDIYSAIKRIVDDYTLEGVEPLLAEPLATLRATTAFLHVGYQADFCRDSFASLVKNAEEIMQGHVAQALGLSYTADLVGLEVLRPLVEKFDRLDIFTLNHDVLLERALAGVPIADGFADTADKGFRLFTGDWSAPERKVRLFKLHGSLGWWRYAGDDQEQFYCVAGDPNYLEVSETVSRYVAPAARYPEFITGTTIKERFYGSGLTRRILCEFDRVLPEHDTVVCCGYGWGDKGINSRLAEWMAEKKSRKIVILHGGSDADSPLTKRFWRARAHRPRGAPQVRVEKTWLSDCDAEFLAGLFR